MSADLPTDSASLQRKGACTQDKSFIAGGTLSKSMKRVFVSSKHEDPYNSNFLGIHIHGC